MDRRKNILFLFSDQHRGDWMPYDRETCNELKTDALPLGMPNIRNLMDNGVTFTHNASNSPLCVPARACLASGLHYDHCRVYNNDYCYPLSQRTFYSVLKNAGYNVCGVGKFDLHKPIFFWDKSGWIKQLSTLGFTDAIDSEGKYDLLWSSFYTPRGPYAYFLTENRLFEEHARDYVIRYLNSNEVRPTPLPAYAYSDNWVADNAVEKLKKLTADRKPWFLMVNFPGPHNPWDVTGEMRDRWKDVKFPIPDDYLGNPDELNAIRQNYAAMIENIDSNIGLLMKELEKTGELENTIIIYAADHGEMMGDRNRFMKSVPYRGAVHIPLVISGPDVLKGAIRSELVQLHDIAATIVDFAGLSMPEAKDSKSLRSLACDAAAGPVRDYQAVMLYNSLRFGKEYEDYLEYSQYKKLKSDDEYIAEFNKKLGLEVTKNSVGRFEYKSDWKCIITKKYKLIEFEDADSELYDLEGDPYEKINIAKVCPPVIDELEQLYPFDGIQNN